MTNLIKIFLAFFILGFNNADLKAQGVQSIRPWLGIGIEKGEKGVRVHTSFPDTPAFLAGIKAGDEILKVGEVVVSTPQELITEVAKKGVGYKVKIEFQRKEKILSEEITLVVMPDMLSVAKKKLLGQPVFDFEANYISKAPSKKSVFKMKEHLGVVTLLEFWATWCPACLSADPRLIQFAKENRGKIKVIAISDETAPILKKHLKAHGKNKNDILYLQSPEGKVNSLFMASSIPMFILIDKKGQVVDLDLGAGSVLEALLNKAQTLF